MTTVEVLNPDGTASGTVELPADIFDVAINVPLLHQVVVAQQAAARQGTASAKTRGEVSGGGAKPYRQKGTGRARQGSTRAPQFVGGGVVHGPVPRSYVQRTPKKMKAAALRGALSDRARGGRLHVLTTLVPDGVPSTKAAVAALSSLTGARHVLVVLGRDDTASWKSLRNLASVHAIAPDQLNTYDVLVSDDVVFTRSALDAFLAGPARGRSVKAQATSAEAGALTEEPATVPATEAGTTAPAGAGLTDEEMVTEVADQTSPDLAVQPFFEREVDGVATETEAAKASADEVAGTTDEVASVTDEGTAQ